MPVMTPDSPASAMHESTERLYKAFASAKRGAIMRACPCCVAGEATADLCRAPLRELSEEDIARYAFKAMTTWGDEEDYRFFFPRILELSDMGRSSQPGLALWLIRGKLELARWRTWPAAELEAVDLYLDALFHGLLTRIPSEHSAADALKELSYLKLDIRPWLKAWQRTDSSAATRQLAATVSGCWQEMARSGLAFSCPSDVPSSVRANAQTLDEWLRSSTQRERLESAFEQCGDDQVGRELGEALDAYQWL